MSASLNQKISKEERDFKAALRRAPYGDDAEVGRMTAEIVGRGHSILQIHKLADNDHEHVDKLLALMEPAQNAVILDAGCGVGRVAGLMAECRADLDFILLNVSQSQLDLCPSQFRRVRADFHATGLPDANVDGVMFNYSLGHGLLPAALAEAHRVLRPEGVLFIYDLASEDSSRLIETLGYKAHSRARVEGVATDIGFRLDHAGIIEDTSLGDFADILDRETFSVVFDGVFPAVYRFTK